MKPSYDQTEIAENNNQGHKTVKAGTTTTSELQNIEHVGSKLRLLIVKYHTTYNRVAEKNYVCAKQSLS